MAGIEQNKGSGQSCTDSQIYNNYQIDITAKGQDAPQVNSLNLHSKLYQKLESVGALGPKGSHSQFALLSYGGYAAVQINNIHLEKNFVKVFSSLKKGNVSHIYVPIHNNLSGDVSQVKELLAKHSDFTIVAQFDYRVKFALLGYDFSKIKKIYSHRQAFAQCRGFLRTVHASECNTDSTSEAARIVSEKKNSAFAAIANPEAAPIYRLKILFRGLEDTDSITTFALVQRGT